MHFRPGYEDGFLPFLVLMTFGMPARAHKKLLGQSLNTLPYKPCQHAFPISPSRSLKHLPNQTEVWIRETPPLHLTGTRSLPSNHYRHSAPHQGMTQLLRNSLSSPQCDLASKRDLHLYSSPPMELPELHTTLLCQWSPLCTF